jgi:hypothetical protein
MGGGLEGATFPSILLGDKKISISAPDAFGYTL